MFKTIYEKLEKEISGEIAYNFVKEITRHHRIQASPGMWDAVNYIVESLQGYGLQTRLHSYPANGTQYYWSNLMFKEWSCRDAWLKLTQPEKKERFLARWDESKLSLIQRSYPTNGELEAEVVLLDKGIKEKDYKKINVEGKIILTDGDIEKVHDLAVERYGALGIIYDGTWVRPPSLKKGELDDALKYTSFWWSGEEKPAFGFVLTPRTGRWLRELVEDEKDPVKVKAFIDSKLYEGSIENAVATVQGYENEKVIVVAHICHPQPSANDNASGSAAAMEAARALNKLIDDRILPKPKRSIIFTWVPEMTGTYAFLNEIQGEIPNIIAAINLDMVGEKQDITGSPLLLERTPEATPSYVNSVMEAIYDEVKKQASNLGGSSDYPLFKHAVTPFSGGSDHYIYNDPTVGVACPMIIQWPDKFWHTSYDTLEKVDPGMLRKVALMTATYTYFVADADPSRATWIASETASREKRRLQKKLQNEVTKILNTETENKAKAIAKKVRALEGKIDYWTGRAVEAVNSVKRLTYDQNIQSLIENLSSDIKNTSETLKKLAIKTINDYAETKGMQLSKARKPRKKKIEKNAEKIIPKRKYRGPVSLRSWIQKLSSEKRYEWYEFVDEHKEDRLLVTLANYWVDGERNLLEISKLIEYETGKTDLEYFLQYYKWLEKMELVELTP